MLSPDYLDEVGNFGAALYEPFQISVIEDMARRIVRLGEISDSTMIQFKQLQESGLLFDYIVSEVAKLTSYSEQELEKLFFDAGAEAILFDDDVYKQAGLNPTPIHQSPTMLDILLAGLRKTNGALKNLTMTTATATQTQFISAMDLAYMQVSSGSMNYIQAIRAALINLAAQGITSVRYDKNGRSIFHKVDVAARRAVLTGVNQTAAELQFMRLKEMDWNLVEVTAHIGARPSHAAWQGKVYSTKDNSEYPDFISSTGYGTGDGLCGWNCRHSFFPFLAVYNAYTAAELNDYKSKTVSYNDKQMSYYDATQIQRRLERDIRDYKRELSALNAGVLAATEEALKNELRSAFQTTSIKLKEKERSLKDFVSSTGLVRQREREQVVRFGRSEAQKAVWADKKK